MGWHLQRTGHVLVDRSKSGAGVVKKMARLVRQRHSLIVFPEGTRSIDGSVARFKGGLVPHRARGRPAGRADQRQGSRHVMFRGRADGLPRDVTRDRA